MSTPKPDTPKAGIPGGYGRIPSRLPIELIARIKAWRQTQPVPPSMTQTIAYLLECGLAAVTAKEPPT